MGVIVFLGDSITDAGRTTSCPPLGNGYVKGFADSVSQNWNVLNQGVDGYITERIAEDLHKDCIAFHPNYVSILVGINDVGLIAEADTTEHEKLYMLEESIRAYHEMLFDLSRETQAEIITLEPFIFPKDGKYENWVPWQKKMSKNIRKLARNYHARFISVQEPLNREIERLGHDAITTDCIHLTAKGHEILAKIVRDGFGF